MPAPNPKKLGSIKRPPPPSPSDPAAPAIKRKDAGGAARQIKAKLAQERSRDTRHKIVKAGLTLWKQRGFEEGFDTTTVEDIADKAGVSRATIYYHFPKKEDILRELAWLTAAEIYELALRSLMTKRSVDEVLEEIMTQIGQRLVRSSPAIIRRMLSLPRDAPESIARDSADGGMTRAFSVVISHAQHVGDLSAAIAPIEFAEMLSAVCISCISQWSISEKVDVVAVLCRRAGLLLAGARAIAGRSPDQ